MPELKPCPFCGDDVQFSFDLERAVNGIFCRRCHMMVMYTNIECRPRDPFGETMERYAERWNGRCTE